MSLTLNFNSVLDMFCKLQRDADLLDEKVTSDRLFNFVVTAWSMIDWVKNDRSLPNNVQDLYNDQWLKICQEIATGYKHFRLDPDRRRRPPITSSANSATGFGHGRLGKGPFGKGEESITIHLNDNRSFYALELVEGVLNTWKNYFLNQYMLTGEQLEDRINQAREA